jgi:type II secretory pathway component PulC
MFDDIIAPLLATEWGRRSGYAAAALSCLLLLTTFIDLPLSWHKDYKLAHNPAAAMNKNLQLNSQALALIAQIPNQHLFGISGRSTDIPITSLQIRLVGIVQAVPAGQSRAIISIAGQPAKIYQVGDTLTGDVRITAITQESVLLENGNQTEKLPLARPPLSFEGMPKNLLPGE